MINKPKISFLVTYYNQHEYVKDSLESILKQKIPCEYEVLVGDDGSDDGSVDEVLKYRLEFKDRLHIFKNKRDDGIKDKIVRASNLRKRLLWESQGDYFMTLDGDDFYCYDDFLTEAFTILDNVNMFSLVMFNYEMFYKDRVEKQRWQFAKEGRHGCNDYVRSHYSPAGASVLRTPGRAVMKNINKALYYDDTDIILFQLNLGDIYYTNKCIYAYRQTGKSIWTSLSKAKQGVLNVFGADSGTFLAPGLKEDIYLRYRRDILYGYFRREKIRELVGDEFYEENLKFATDNELFLGRYLLLPKNENSTVENEIEKAIDLIRNYDPKLFEKIKKDVDSENKI